MLWGGDSGVVVDNVWFIVLCKLCYCLVDGMVWVILGFDGVLIMMNRMKFRFMLDEMDSVFYFLKLCFEVFGWKLFLYVWLLYEGGNEKNGCII